MSRYISKKNRLAVKDRANATCEYCKIQEIFSLVGYEIDHIISKKHGGTNDLDNLAYACAICNYSKGTDVGTVLLPEMDYTRFFHPRLDIWNDHFELSNTSLLPRTKIGQATIKILQLNQIRRLEERRELIKAGLFSI